MASCASLCFVSVLSRICRFTCPVRSFAAFAYPCEQRFNYDIDGYTPNFLPVYVLKQQENDTMLKTPAGFHDTHSTTSFERLRLDGRVLDTLGDTRGGSQRSAQQMVFRLGSFPGR